MKTLFYSKAALVLAFSLMLSVSAQAQFWGGGTRGSGKILSDTRPVGEFSKIKLNSSGDVVFTKGTKREVLIEADDNIWESVQTTVENGTLVLGMKSGSWNNIHLKFIITNPTLEGVEIAGSGNVAVENAISGQFLTTNIRGSGSIRYKSGNFLKHEISLQGSGNIDASKIEAEDVTAQIYGSGNTSAIATKNLNVVVSGSGNLNADKVQTENVEAQISGSGNASVWVKSTLKASLSGSGSVYYKGSPNVTKTIRGSGSLVQR